MYNDVKDPVPRANEIMIEKYIDILSSLQTTRNTSIWPDMTLNKAPNKPFLVLSVMDLISKGIIKENFVKPSSKLHYVFNLYCTLLIPSEYKTSMSLHFTRLQKDSVWKLVPANQQGRIDLKSVTNMKKLREVYSGAKFTPDLYTLLCNSITRDILRKTIIGAYFSNEIRPALNEQAVVNYDVLQNSEML